jgi:hypothetical protein
MLDGDWNMTETEIKAALHRRPFMPFTLGIADGTTLAVPHPDTCFVAAGAVVVVTYNGDRTRDQMHIVDLDQIARVSFEERAAR